MTLLILPHTLILVPHIISSYLLHLSPSALSQPPPLFSTITNTITDQYITDITTPNTAPTTTTAPTTNPTGLVSIPQPLPMFMLTISFGGFGHGGGFFQAKFWIHNLVVGIWPSNRL